MKDKYHRALTRQALSADVSETALEQILAANLGQDSFIGQLLHSEYHFDESIPRGQAYLHARRQVTLRALAQERTPAAWREFGRLTHAAQDFYAHTNYVALWASKHSDPRAAIAAHTEPLPESLPQPEAIDPLDPDILDHPGLRSDHVYIPLDGVTKLPVLGGLLYPLMPPDSHTRMNLDAPACGPLFRYAFQAALKRTRHEFERLAQELDDAAWERFTGRSRQDQAPA